MRWPSGTIVAGPGPEDPRWADLGGASYIAFESADPNDHYRPWLEKNVGRQGRDWDWYMGNTDVVDNRLTIRIRKSKGTWASVAALTWA